MPEREGVALLAIRCLAHRFSMESATCAWTAGAFATVQGRQIYTSTFFNSHTYGTRHFEAWDRLQFLFIYFLTRIYFSFTLVFFF